MFIEDMVGDKQVEQELMPEMSGNNAEEEKE